MLPLSVTNVFVVGLYILAPLYILYPKILVPPVLVGANQLRVTDLSPAIAVRPVGGPGAVGIVTAAEGSDAEELPTVFVATTVNV